jgi:hypothetical protein
MIGAAEFTKERRIFGDILDLAIDSFRANRARFFLTSLGMALGTASLIWVVTIGLAGQNYALTSIQNVGANLIWAEYASFADPAVRTEADFLTSAKHQHLWTSGKVHHAGEGTELSKRTKRSFQQRCGGTARTGHRA